MMKNKLKEYIEPRIEVMAIAYHAVLMEPSLPIDDGNPTGPAKSRGFDFIEKKVDPDLWDNSNEMWALEDEEE